VEIPNIYFHENPFSWGVLIHGKRPGTQSRSGRERKISLTSGFDPRSI